MVTSRIIKGKSLKYKLELIYASYTLNVIAMRPGIPGAVISQIFRRFESEKDLPFVCCIVCTVFR